MGHNIQWDNRAKTVVFQEYDDNPTKEDLYLLAEKSAEMLATVRHTVNLIIDERNVSHIINTKDMAYLEKLTPRNQGIVAVVIQRRKVGYKTLIQKLAKPIGPNAFSAGHFMETVEDARAFLQVEFGVRYP